MKFTQLSQDSEMFYIRPYKDVKYPQHKVSQFKCTAVRTVIIHVTSQSWQNTVQTKVFLAFENKTILTQNTKLINTIHF